MIRAFFQGMTTREQWLIGAVLWVGLLIWMSYLFGGFGDINQRYRASEVKLNFQEQTLALANQVDNQLQQEWSQLDHKRMHSARQLAEKIDAYARQYGLAISARTPVTENYGLFKVHTSTIDIRNAKMEQLIQFDNRLKADAPYLMMDKVKLSTTNNIALFKAGYTIKAFEFAEPPTTPDA